MSVRLGVDTYTKDHLLARLPGAHQNGRVNCIGFRCVLCGADKASALIIDNVVRYSCSGCFQSRKLAEALAHLLEDDPPKEEEVADASGVGDDRVADEEAARAGRNGDWAETERTQTRQVPPYDLVAEQSVLSAILLEPNVLSSINEWLVPSAFYDQRNKFVYRGMLALSRSERPIDAITLRPTLEAMGVFDKIGGAGYLAELIPIAPTALNVAYYGKIVQAKAVQREVLNRARRIAFRAYNEKPDNIDAWLDDVTTHFTTIPQIIGLAKQQGPRELPAPQTASEWFSQEETRFANTTFIWKDILEAGGLSIITGKKGNGKSTFTRTLSLCLARGIELLGRTTERVRVWYIDLEPGGRGRIETWKKMGWTDDDGLDINTIPPVADNPKKFEWLRDNIVAHKYGVVIMDTLFKFLKIEGANDYDKGVYAQVPLEEISRDTGCHFICLHHARKNSMSEGRSVAEEILGATSLAGAACACMLINRRGSTYTFRMDPPRYGEAIEGEVVLEQGNGGWVFDGGNYKGRWIKNGKAWTLDAIKKRTAFPFKSGELVVEDPTTGQQLASKTVAFLLKLLVADGELKVEGEGKRGDPFLYSWKA